MFMMMVIVRVLGVTAAPAVTANDRQQRPRRQPHEIVAYRFERICLFGGDRLDATLRHQHGEMGIESR